MGSQIETSSAERLEWPRREAAREGVAAANAAIPRSFSEGGQNEIETALSSNTG
ncbi:MAG: hypothetical protein UZ19_OD1000181, partial [Parcubacteria bacterium OLB19]